MVRRPSSAGFVLIEVLVAVAVAAVILTALLRAFVTTWTGISAVREEAEAMLIARALIYTAAQRNNTVEANQNGNIGRYGWTLEVKRVVTSQPAGPSEGSESETSFAWTLYRVAVVIIAPSGRRTNLETSRLSKTAR